MTNINLKGSGRVVIDGRRIRLDAKRHRRVERIGRGELRTRQIGPAETPQTVVPQFRDPRQVALQRFIHAMQFHADAAIHAALGAQCHETRMPFRGGATRERARGAARDWDALFDYRRLAPHALDMHPSDEHLLPWFVAAGAGGRDAAALRLHASQTHGSLGMDAYAFGSAVLRLQQALAGAAIDA